MVDHLCSLFHSLLLFFRTYEMSKGFKIAAVHRKGPAMVISIFLVRTRHGAYTTVVADGDTTLCLHGIIINCADYNKHKQSSHKKVLMIVRQLVFVSAEVKLVHDVLADFFSQDITLLQVGAVVDATI